MPSYRSNRQAATCKRTSLAQRQLMHEHVYTFPCLGEIPAAVWLALTTGKGRVISILLVLLM